MKCCCILVKADIQTNEKVSKYQNGMNSLVKALTFALFGRQSITMFGVAFRTNFSYLTGPE